MMHSLKSLLLSKFSFPEEKLFCQVSTTHNDIPHVRTMRLYHVTDEGYLVLLTGTSTRKWNDLKHSSQIALCMLNLNFGQMVFEGAAVLKTVENDADTTSIYWNMLDSYWQNFYLSHSSGNQGIPETFGVIIVQPHTWDVLELDQERFLQSSRKQYRLVNGVWEMHELSPE